MKKWLIVWLFVNLGLTYANAQSKEWILTEEENGIKIYTRDSGIENLTEVKAELTVDVPVENCAAVFLDIGAYTEWIYSTIETEVLKVKSNRNIIYRTVLDMPWPADDRDAILDLNLSYDKSSNTLINKVDLATNYNYPSVVDIVRIPKLKTHWKIKEISTGKCQISYYIGSDPGGDIPGWIVELFVSTGPIESLTKFKEQVKLEKYSNKNYDFIDL
jgi:hypothetical protein